MGHGPAPNLVVVDQNIGFSATEVASGTPITIYATILNTGSSRVENVIVQFVDATSANVKPVGEQQTVEAIETGFIGRRGCGIQGFGWTRLENDSGGS